MRTFHSFLCIILLSSLLCGCSEKAPKLYLIEENGLYGFIDSLGNKVIDPKYLFATPFSGDVALVVTDTIGGFNITVNYHYINCREKVIGKNNYIARLDGLSFKYGDKISLLSRFSYSGGRALFQSRDTSTKGLILEKYGYIDKKGCVVIPCEYNDGGLFHDGKAMVQESIDHSLERITNTGESLDILQKNYLKWQVIDDGGNAMTDFIFDKKSAFDKGRCVAEISTSSDIKGFQSIIYVLLNENADIICTFSTGGARKYSDGVIIEEVGPLAMLGSSSEFYDRDGNKIRSFSDLYPSEQKIISQSPAFLTSLPEIIISFAKGFSDGLCVCTTGDKDSRNWFFVDVYKNLYGNATNDLFAFEDALLFSSGLAAIKKDGKWGYVDHNFDLIIPCQYDSASSFNGDLAMVENNMPDLTIRSYINKTGKPVWQQVQYHNPAYEPNQK